MSHRGGCGCDEASGDGAGILIGIPDSYYRKKYIPELSPSTSYGTGIIFIPKDTSSTIENSVKELFEQQSILRGLKMIKWVEVEVDNSQIGGEPISTEPIMRQIFIENTSNLNIKDFERELFTIRKMVEALSESDTGTELYVSSLSSQTITYKGQLTPEQVMQYFKDLQDPTLETHMALVHSRFSTNTFPSWERAQPVRMMCHNGEINTLRGNKNWMFSRGSLMHTDVFASDEGRGEHADKLLCNTSDNMSDSGNFDAVLDLLAKGSDRSLPECIMMMIPEAWQDNDSLSINKTAFYDYNSCLMEPWDGPAMIAFTDGRYVGATLDRNGLRPSRYYVTHDNRILLSSEVGVVPDLPESLIKYKQRLEPGKMFLVDFDKQKIVSDTEIKEEIASKYDYANWIKEYQFSLSDWVEANQENATVPEFNFSTTNRRLNMFGYTSETLDMLLYPMGAGGKEALGSMGNDAALAVMSTQPRLVFDYFKQLFAQVTNPPIDPIREEMVMSLRCPVGPEGNLLQISPTHAHRMVVDHPILTLQEMQSLKDGSYRGWRSSVIDTTMPVGAGPEAMIESITRICEEVAESVQGAINVPGNQIIVLSDKMAGEERMAIPSLLVTAAVHQHLVRTKQRPKAALFLETGEAREVHDFATLLGYGVDGICPYVAYEVLHRMNHEGIVVARSGLKFNNEELVTSYRVAAAKGILKVMSKMGISTLQSYKGAEVFEAVGLDEDVMDLCFPNTYSRIKGADFKALYNDMTRLHDAAYPLHSTQTPLLRNPGAFHYRNNGEIHLNTPEGMAALQVAARTNSKEAYRQYATHIDETNKGCNLRGIMRFSDDAICNPISIEEVESAAMIVKRFNTGAMSLGSISQETHETLAIAMNELGGRSNTGEGGEDPKRFHDNRRSSIKQVASGRFGVTSHYLANSDQIQIKMAQGAKPGEGGELPGFKVTSYIAENRMTTPGVGLISPPPHHDIYSIEDLAQLIHDLKNAQPNGEVSVKLVSEVGVGVVAAGVAKAKADHITISGGDGGTGAAAWTGVKGAGLPWELGLAEAQQTLVINGLRDRIRLQTDGQMKNGRDVVLAAMLGAEEFGFSTAPLIALGCIMMRKCHLNTCPVGIATQDPLLRSKFSGQPEHVINFFFLLAEEVRAHLAQLGAKSLDEIIGRSDLISVDRDSLHEKNEGLDLTSILVKAGDLNPSTGILNSSTQDHNIDNTLDRRLIEMSQPALNEGVPVTIDTPVTNIDRTVGTMLSYEISKKFGKKGLPDETIRINAKGHGGQSFGFCVAKGITISLEGDSNDYVGKSLSGGIIAVYPDKDCLNEGFIAEDNVIVGNVCLYGGTSGKAFFRGKAGERFAVRNSGVISVVEGVGDHGAEYMTGGRVVVLGETGRNFAAGMSGGIAYIYDPHGKFPARCNMGMVGLEKLDNREEQDQVKSYLEEHVSMTNSTVAQNVLNDWQSEIKNFVKVMPHDYKRVLEQATANNNDNNKNDNVKVV